MYRGGIALKTRIKQILAEVKAAPDLAATLSDDADIINEVGLDSLQVVTFLFKLEEAFEIEIDFEQFDYSDLNSIRRLAEKLSSLAAL